MDVVSNLRLFARVYFAIWLVTVCAAAIATLSPSIAAQVQDTFVLTFQPLPANLAEVGRIFARNTATISIPIALAYILSPWRSPQRGVFATGFVFLLFLPNLVIVGLAAGAYGSRLFAYLPHLAVEWAAVAVAATTWVIALRRPLSGAQLATVGGLNAVVIAVGAFIETYAGPTL